ncbi:MAG: hypothetical protein IKL04_04975 [Lachnospiraceae bacterium]|nr:hypothetical protein [Lachnospiraceae bacterium]
MKFIKFSFYVLCGVLMVACIATLIYAFNPEMTRDLSNKLYGDGENGGLLQDVELYPLNKDAGLNAEVLTGLGQGGYISPSRDDISTPVPVIGMSGFAGIHTDNVQVEEETSGQPGETGKGLTFDARIYPYYNMLDGTMKELYAQIYANAMTLNSTFKPVTDVDVNQLKNVFEAVYNDHPQLFWLEGSYSCKYLKSGKCTEIELLFNETTDYIELAQSDFKERADRIVRGAMVLEGDFVREKYVHDELVARVNYDAAAEMSQSAYSALVNGRTVCAGYARAFQYIMQQLGIPCFYCAGYSGMDHAWNIVKQGSQYYNVDVTWDDTNPATWDYYNRSDIALSGTHMRTGLSVYLPACVNSANLNPLTGEPLLGDKNESDSTGSEDEKHKLDLEEAGIKEADVSYTLQEYYADCKKQMKEAGMGKHTFKNVIPESLWTRIESDYINESYLEMYVREVLKELNAEHFAIQLQPQRLGGGFYRLYHNISVWNDPKPSVEESSDSTEETGDSVQESSQSSEESTQATDESDASADDN